MLTDNQPVFYGSVLGHVRFYHEASRDFPLLCFEDPFGDLIQIEESDVSDDVSFCPMCGEPMRLDEIEFGACEGCCCG